MQYVTVIFLTHNFSQGRSLNLLTMGVKKPTNANAWGLNISKVPTNNFRHEFLLCSQNHHKITK